MTTPRPWYQQGSEVISNGVHPTSGSNFVADCEEKADAALIVLAVNNFEAFKEVARAAKRRTEKGHNDTCGQMLSPEYECSCGHDILAYALSRLPEEVTR